MIKVVMFDLGQTLIDEATRQPFPHVLEALTAITKAHPAPRTCLVSDFKMELTPAEALKEYVGILEAAGLRSFFKPVQKRVTLSNHAGALKPSREIFKKALQRLGVPATPFKRCCFITENSAHIKAARKKLHMQAFQFGVDFTDWSEVPAMLGVTVSVAAAAWHTISVPGHEDLKDIQVEAPDSPNALEEVKSFVASLANHGQITGRPGKPAVRATHALVTDAKGQRRLVRKGFSQF